MLSVIDSSDSARRTGHLAQRHPLHHADAALGSDTLNAGFAAGLYVTHDGGQIWSTLQPLDNGPPPSGGFDFNGSILDFVSTTLGWTDTFTGDADDLLQTMDGGHTWKRVTVQITGSF